MKKSGLADSPFFQAPPLASSETTRQNLVQVDTERKTVRKSERSPLLPQEPPNEKPNGLANDIPNDRTEKRTVDMPTKRLTKRYSFEFYEDQITRLKQMKYQAEMRGESTTLSAIVRHALDLYLHSQEA